MGQGGAAEWAGRCCVRGDRRTTMVHGDDARESPADEAHGECGARGHAAESSGEVLRTIDSGPKYGGGRDSRFSHSENRV